MNGQENQGRDYRFLTGLALGSLVGAGLAMWLVPRAAAEIKARAADSAKNLGDALSERYRGARLRVTEAAYVAGGTDLSSLLETARNAERVHLEHVGATADFERAYADLERAVGADLPRARRGGHHD